MPKPVELKADAKAAYYAQLRPGTAADRLTLATTWVPMLDRGPLHWLDRDWPWETFGDGELHLDMNPEWLVIADEVGPTATGELFGVLVTTGPVTAQDAGIGDLMDPTGEPLMWVEYIAIAPSLRSDCLAHQRRKSHVKVVGPQLMMAAIARSQALGADGRIGLHAEGDGARETYTKKWNMRDLGNAAHRTGDAYPVCFGDAAGAADFCAGPSKKGGTR